QHRYAAGAGKDGVGGWPRRLLAPVEGEDLDNLVLIQGTQPPTPSAARIQSLDQCKLWCGRLVAVDAQHQQPLRGDRSRKSSQRLKCRCLRQVEVVQD